MFYLDSSSACDGDDACEKRLLMRSSPIIRTAVPGVLLAGALVCVAACGSENSEGSSGGSGPGTGGASGAGATGGASGSNGTGGTSSGGSSGVGATGGSDGSGGATGSGGGDTGGTGGAGGSAGAACESYVITYDITGKFNITGTPLGLGDAENDIGSGELAIRFADGGNAPAPGSARLLSYRMPMNFAVATAGLTVTTNIVASAAHDDCGRAEGTLSGTTLGWATCTYGAGHGTPDWTPDGAASGPGCIRDYNSSGNVNCNDQSAVASCAQGDLQDGDNPQDETFDHPLNSFVFSEDLSSFQMRGAGGPAGSDDKGVETPNRAPGQTWWNLDGTEKSREKMPTPACACP